MDIERLESVFEPAVPSRPGDRRRWARLYGSGKGLAIAAAVRRHRGPCLVIVPNAAESGRIADEVRFFGGDGLESLAFPDWETLPYDRFSPGVADPLLCQAKLGVSCGVRVPVG